MPSISLTGKSEVRHSIEDVFPCRAHVHADSVVVGQAVQVKGVMQIAGVAVRLQQRRNKECDVNMDVRRERRRRQGVEVWPGRMDIKRHAKRRNSCWAVKVT